MILRAEIYKALFYQFDILALYTRTVKVSDMNTLVASL